MKTKIIFPPAWEVTQPYLSVPSLFAYLKERDIEVSQLDLNVVMFDLLLTKKNLLFCRKRILEQFENYSKENKHKINIFDNLFDYFVENVEPIKKQFRSKESLDLGIYTKCLSFINQCFEFISLAYYPEKIYFGDYKSSYDFENYNEIMESINNKEKNIFYTIFCELIDSIIEDNDFIAISVTGSNQVIPSFILASMIKKINPEIKICFGGSTISRLAESVCKHKGFFDIIDFILLFEGEEALYKLINCLEKDDDLSNVPNLIYMNKDKILKNEIMENMKINDLPCPIFDKDNFHRYFWPEPVLPLLTSRGCYWRRCAFCDHSYVYRGNYNKRSYENILNDLLTLKKEYNVKNINFHDEAIEPKTIEYLVKIINENELDIKWTCDSRFDIKLTKDLLSEASLSGLKILFFGLESANERVLRFMNKGINTNIVKKIISDSSACGIWNHIFFFLGFPTETYEEALDTINFIKQNEYNIGSSGCSKFVMGKYSIVANDPQKYHVKISDSQKDLAIYYNFIYEKHTRKENIDLLHSEIINNPMGMYKYYSNIVKRDHWVMLYDSIRNIEESNGNYRIKPWVYYCKSDDKFFVYDMLNGKAYYFTLESANVFDLIAKYGDVKLVANELKQEYECDYDEVKSIVSKFIETLVQKEIV